ncbi:hypothetical protein OAL86_01665 [Verrucomicrobia bacterium]|nr:hypothetical protein [Verrucomicrobiota bacterium]
MTFSILELNAYQRKPNLIIIIKKRFKSLEDFGSQCIDYYPLFWGQRCPHLEKRGMVADSSETLTFNTSTAVPLKKTSKHFGNRIHTGIWQDTLLNRTT